MGFYEIIHDCGNGNYCVSIGAADFNNCHWIRCKFHKEIRKKGSKFEYSLENFFRRYGFNRNRSYYNVEVVDSFSKYEVMRVFGAASISENLNPKKKIYFSQYNDEPSWKVDGEDLIIIDHYYSSMIKPPPIYEGNEYRFCWDTYKIVKVNR